MASLADLLMGEIPVRTVIPALRVHSEFHHKSSVYPDEVHIPMVDGHTVVYVRKDDQPHPSFTRSVEIIQRMVGYQAPEGYQGRHERK